MTDLQLVLTALAVLVGAAAALALRARLERWRMQRRFARGRVGEQQAVRLLERSGYRILQEQLSQETGFWMDEQWCPVTVRADFLVERRGKRFVAEVKTGSTAPNPASTATRRQLLEYSHVYDADGLLLVDMQSRRLHCIRFGRGQPLAPPRRSYAWLWLLVGLCGGFLLGLAVR